jgi:UDP-N-acetylmuramyl pentapeptide phosphotransferase/UDP-N-acetylglucosamine-1-phosphate transferase
MDKALIIIVPFVLSLVLCRAAMTLKIMDAPDGARKTQAVPVPRTGGLGLCAAVLLSLAGFVVWLGFDLAEFVGVLVANRLAGPVIYLLGLAVIGFLDDVVTLPALFKFVLIWGLCLIGAAYGPSPQNVWLPMFGETGIGSVVAVGGAALWLFVVANSVNFMDGSNGLSMGSSTVFFLVAAVLLSPFAGVSWEANYIVGLFSVALMVSAAIAGFLVWNLQGRIYAGDMGALFTGGLMGVFGLLIGQFYSIWLAPLLVLPFIADVLLTMQLRARRGENLLAPHREHAYQLLLRTGWQHGKVAVVWWGLVAVCGAAALIAVKVPLMRGQVSQIHALSLAVFVAALVLSVTLWMIQRKTLGKALERDGL